MSRFDVVILGAGAAGMMCAIEAGRRGRSVLILDHARAPGEKIRISGGGRCNFTNLEVAPDRFISANPNFCRAALSRYTQSDFIAKVTRHGIPFHEKTLGQLFCDGSAREIIDMLTGEMRAAACELRLGCSVEAVAREASGFALVAGGEAVECASLVVATGGKSIPKMGATDFAYRLAAEFGIHVVETRPGLVPLTFPPALLERTAPLSGLSVDARVSCGRTSFDEALLFTHRGLSGPAILQISSYWSPGDEIVVDMAPGTDVAAEVRDAKIGNGRQKLRGALSPLLPKRLASLVEDESGCHGPLAELSGKRLEEAARFVNAWRLKPTGTEGYRTAEVTVGGIDTKALDQKTMMVKSVPGLYFIGEAVDVTGWLGGYNFQWAWSSGFVAGQAA
ncbi:MAG: NAD(P)/FAD-dependent oxidoreductase [Rhodobiaceae bacterium]|nr:NAD(P)/FAD-dependent oxidoreductase [Rhodobiaceae bacterium]